MYPQQVWLCDLQAIRALWMHAMLSYDPFVCIKCADYVVTESAAHRVTDAMLGSAFVRESSFILASTT